MTRLEARVRQSYPVAEMTSFVAKLGRSRRRRRDKLAPISHVHCPALSLRSSTERLCVHTANCITHILPSTRRSHHDCYHTNFFNLLRSITSSTICQLPIDCSNQNNA